MTGDEKAFQTKIKKNDINVVVLLPERCHRRKPPRGEDLLAIEAEKSLLEAKKREAKRRVRPLSIRPGGHPAGRRNCGSRALPWNVGGGQHDVVAAFPSAGRPGAFSFSPVGLVFCINLKVYTFFVCAT